MPIFQQGTLNTTALVVPDIYVQIVPPQNLVINGVPTNVIGAVGTAVWGPVGQPVIVGDYAAYNRAFGPLQARKFDMGTQVATAVLQGAQAFRCVRVTDGTDVAAVGGIYNGTPAVGSALLSLVARYTGTFGNSITVTMQAGSAAGTWRAVVAHPVLGAESFDNIVGPTGTTSQAYSAFWSRVVTAINAGTGVQRGPSQMVSAGAGDATAFIAPAAGQTATLSNGTDGAGTITGATLIGVDTVPRKGMYALRGQGVSILLMADLDDSTQWTTVASFAGAVGGEGMYAILAGPAGDTIANAVTVKATAGLDTYTCKLMLGDWVYWRDPVNAVLRLVSPAGFVAGRLANLSPEQSSLNKPLYGVVATQKSGLPGSAQAGSYSTAELTVLLSAGLDVIANPQPGGAYWGVRGGHNTSSNPGTNGDNYTRLTNYIASTLNSGMGAYVGQVINAGLFRRIRATLLGFANNLLGQGLLGSLDGSLPFSIVCDQSNNPFSRTSLGYVQADAQIQYQAINERFIVNLEGGQTVQVTRQTLPSGQV